MREFRALKAQWSGGIERAQAIAATLLATLHNGMFQTDGVPWIAADFLGNGNREDRKAKHTMEQYNIQMANLALAQRKSDDTEGLPEWALWEKKKEANG